VNLDDEKAATDQKSSAEVSLDTVESMEDITEAIANFIEPAEVPTAVAEDLTDPAPVVLDEENTDTDAVREATTFLHPSPLTGEVLLTATGGTPEVLFVTIEGPEDPIDHPTDLRRAGVPQYRPYGT
jgi:hypothetical protein